MGTLIMYGVLMVFVSVLSGMVYVMTLSVGLVGDGKYRYVKHRYLWKRYCTKMLKKVVLRMCIVYTSILLLSVVIVVVQLALERIVQ